jgi:hypothetical protein
MHVRGMGDTDESGSREDRSRGGEEGALVHGRLSWLAGQLRPYQVIRGEGPARYSVQRIFSLLRGVGM